MNNVGYDTSAVFGEDYPEIRESVRKLCAGYPAPYWRDLEKQPPSGSYPSAFIEALTEAGYLGALIPEQYGGSGLALRAAGVILETIQATECSAAACHAQMYTMGTLLRHGSEEQKRAYLPKMGIFAQTAESAYSADGWFCPTPRKGGLRRGLFFADWEESVLLTQVTVHARLRKSIVPHQRFDESTLFSSVLQFGYLGRGQSLFPTEVHASCFRFQNAVYLALRPDFRFELGDGAKHIEQ